MDFSVIQQFNQSLNKSKNVLIVFPKDYDADTLSSALAFRLFLKKTGKNAAIVCDDFLPSGKITFLPGVDSIQSKLSLSRKFVISLDVSRVKIGELSYDLGEDKLNIFLTPKSGSFAASDVSSAAENFPYDLIVAVGSPEIEALGKIYSDRREFFRQTPLLNLDRRPENKNYGQINLVDASFSSLAEIIFKLIGSINFEFLDEQIATCLLTGIISKNAFKEAPAEPQSLITASRLMAKGGKKEEIVKNIYCRQPLPISNLNGLAAASLKEQSDGQETPDKSKIIWSLLKKEELQKFLGASEEKMEKEMEGLFQGISWAEIIVLLYEKSSDDFLEKLSDDSVAEINNIHGIIKVKNGLNALEIVQSFNPQGDATLAKFGLKGADFFQAEKTVLEEIKKNLNGEG